MQRCGNRMRFSVQLIDTETGNHLWAQRFDKPVADPFDMQDEIVARLANAVGAQLYDVEARRAELKPNLDATDLCFRGRAWVTKGFTPDNLAEARSCFERALELEPENFNVLGRHCICGCISRRFFLSRRPKQTPRRGRGGGDQGAIISSRVLLRPHMLGRSSNIDQPLRPSLQLVRTGVDTEPKSRRGARAYWNCQDACRSG